MAFLKPALRMLENIEQRKYEEALRIIEERKTTDCIALTAPDLIYKVAYSLGNQENVQMKLLLVRLLDLLTSIQEKYEIIYELLTLRTSLHLTEVLMDQLSSLIDDNSLEAYPKVWDQICNELPLKLEKRLCERLLRIEEELQFTIQEATLVLAFFRKVPFTVSYKFDKLVNAVLNHISPDETAAYPFLQYHFREHPFSPRLWGHESPVLCLPHVYDIQFLQLKLAEGICDYISSTKQLCNDVRVKPLANVLRFLHNLCDDFRELHGRQMSDVYSEMFVLIGLLIGDENLYSEADRSLITSTSQLIVARFPADLRILLLKRVLERIVSETRICAPNKCKFLAWLLDQIDQNMSERLCSNEMGSIFGLLECLIWEDDPSLAGYYSPVLQIINTYSQNCANLPLLAETRERLAVRIRNSLLRYLQRDGVTGTPGILPDGSSLIVQSNRYLPLCREQSDSQLRRILKKCEQTLAVIDEVIGGLPCS